jgi:hypothetical protein
MEMHHKYDVLLLMLIFSGLFLVGWYLSEVQRSTKAVLATHFAI